MVPEDVLSTGN